MQIQCPPNIKNPDKFKFLPYQDTRKLAELFSKSAVLIYPVYFEGFGLPPVEAMAFGCSTVTTPLTSLPEIYGNSVTYCNPENYHDIARGVLHTLNCTSTDLTRHFLRINSQQTNDLGKLIKIIRGDTESMGEKN